MTRPRVRVVVVDHDGRDLTMRCLEHLVATDHPDAALAAIRDYYAKTPR